MEIGSSLVNLVKGSAPPPPPPPPPPPEPAAPPAAAAPAPVGGALPPATLDLATAVETGLQVLAMPLGFAGDQAALLQVFANRTLEGQALGGLPAGRADAYQEAAGTLDEQPRLHLGMQLGLLQNSFGGGALDTAKGWLDSAKDAVQKRLGLKWTEQPTTAPPKSDADMAAAADTDLHRQQVMLAWQDLPDADRARYDEVKAALGANPAAVARLEQMLLDGQLPGAKDLKDGKSTLENLATLAKAPLAPELAAKRGELLADTLREIQDPTTVNQKDRNTCGAATVQGWLASTQPSEYVRLVTGLASPAGEATMRNGQVLQRDPNYMDASDSGRTLSGRLLQPPFMSAAGLGTYDNQKDGTVIPIPGLDVAIPGMIPQGMSTLMEQLAPGAQKTVWTTPGIANHAYEGASPAKPVPVLVNYPQAPGEVGPHWISVVGQDPAKGTVTYRNPWGRTETVSQAEFDRHVYAVVRPTAPANPGVT